MPTPTDNPETPAEREQRQFSLRALLVLVALLSMGLGATRNLGHGGTAATVLALVAAFFAVVTLRRVSTGALVWVGAAGAGALGALVGGFTASVNISAQPQLVAVGIVMALCVSFIVELGWLGSARAAEESRAKVGTFESRDARVRSHLRSAAMIVVAGPAVGALMGLAWNYLGNVHRLDRRDSLIVHIIFGTIVGVAIGIPYAVTWLLLRSRRR